MYHLNTSHLHKNGAGSEWAGERGIQKTIKRCHEINIISTLTSNKNSLKNATNVGFFYCHPKPFGFTVERVHRGEGG